MRKLHAFSILAGLCICFSSQAQTSSAFSGEPTSHSIPEKDMMYKKTVWRTIDLREKQNKPLFANNRQITKIIIDAVKRGELPIYKNDSLTSKISKEEFLANMTMVNDEEELSPAEIEAGFNRQENEVWPGMAQQATGSPTAVANEFLPKELFLLELKEDAVFDKKRSRMYYEIQSLTVLVPATLKTNVRQRDIVVGSFKYADLVRVFRLHKAEARWVNSANDVEQKNLADAFELRLFCSFITKVSNPDDASLEELHGGPKEGLFASQQAADKLLEYEYNLWSF